IEAQQISNELPLLGVNTPRCDADSIELKELMVFMLQVNAVWSDKSCCCKLNAARSQVNAVEGVLFYTMEVLIHTLVQCLSAKRTAWNEFSYSMASAIICLATGKGFSGVETPLFASMLFQPQPQAKEEEVEVPIAPSPHALQDPTPTPHDSPPHEQPATPHDSFIPLLTTFMETCATLSQKVAELEQDKHSQALEILQLKKRVKRLERKKKSKHLGFKRLRKAGTAQRVESSTDTVLGAQEDASKQGGR
nr:hypothetical protein [Tanacetum cinerariifolium]